MKKPPDLWRVGTAIAEAGLTPKPIALPRGCRQEENLMNPKPNPANAAASMVVGAAIMVPGLVFMILGVTFLPFIGLIMGLPVMACSIRFLTMSLRVQKTVEEEARVSVGAECKTVDHEPQVIDMPVPDRGKAAEWKAAA
jgi:hypothetical protein